MIDTSESTKPIRSSFADDPDYLEMIEFFVDAIPERKQDLEESYRLQDFSQLKTQAHQLKGAGGGYGFEGLTVVATELEKACKAGETAAICDHLDQLLGYLDRIAM